MNNDAINLKIDIPCMFTLFSHLFVLFHFIFTLFTLLFCWGSLLRTHVILTPGARGREVPSRGSWHLIQRIGQIKQRGWIRGCVPNRENHMFFQQMVNSVTTSVTIASTENMIFVTFETYKYITLQFWLQTWLKIDLSILTFLCGGRGDSPGTKLSCK